MLGPDREMVEAVREGRPRTIGETRVTLGQVLGYEPYACAREVYVKGHAIASLGYHGYIRVTHPNDRMVIRRLNALLRTFYGPKYGVSVTKRGMIFVTHLKPNLLTGKLNKGATTLEPFTWWEVEGHIQLDPTRVQR